MGTSGQQPVKFKVYTDKPSNPSNKLVTQTTTNQFTLYPSKGTGGLETSQAWLATIEIESIYQVTPGAGYKLFDTFTSQVLGSNLSVIGTTALTYKVATSTLEVGAKAYVKYELYISSATVNDSLVSTHIKEVFHSTPTLNVDYAQNNTFVALGPNKYTVKVYGNVIPPALGEMQ